MPRRSSASLCQDKGNDLLLPGFSIMGHREKPPVKFEAKYKQISFRENSLGDIVWKMSPFCWTVSAWRKIMMTSSNGNIFRVTGEGNSPVTDEFPSQRQVTKSVVVFFDMRQLSKPSRCQLFKTPSCSLWRQCNGCAKLAVTTALPEVIEPVFSFSTCLGGRWETVVHEERCRGELGEAFSTYCPMAIVAVILKIKFTNSL